MTDITLIADLIRSGVDPEMVQRVTAALLEAATTTAPDSRTPAARRQAAYRERKRNKTVTVVTEAGITKHNGCHNTPASPLTPPPSLSPTPPISPTPSLSPSTPPAMSGKGRESKQKPNWRDDAAKIAADANSTPLPDDWTSATILELWGQWCEHRTELALTDKKKPWTVRAARMEISALSAAAEKHGPEAVYARMRTAISSSWQGLNLDSMRPPLNGKTHP